MAFFAPSSTGQRVVTLLSQDHQRCTVTWDAAIRSNVVKHMLDECPQPTEGALEEAVPLLDSSCSAQLLQKVFEFLQKHVDFDKAGTPQDAQNAWDKTFVLLRDEELSRLTLAANFLDVPDLLSLLGRTISERAEMCKTREEIKERFNLPNHLLPRTLSLLSSDGESMVLLADAAVRSAVLKEHIEGLPTAAEGSESEGAPVPLPCAADTAQKLCAYLRQHHLLDRTEAAAGDKEDWDRHFLEMEDEELFGLVKAAHDMQVPGLVEITCKRVAEYIKACKTPEEIRQRFNIPNDFTPEEEEEVRKENAWCDEFP